MGKEIITFGDILPLKKFYFIEDVDIDNVLESNEISPGEKNYN